MDPGACADSFRRCCGSDAWVQSMVAARPFASRDDLLRRSDGIWQSLRREDWLQAFAAHPRIGARADDRWAAREQAGARDIDASLSSRLSNRNREYEARFGYIFIVCATGKSAAEMLALLESRLSNHADDELHIAAEEQRKITRLRLDKLLAESGHHPDRHPRTLSMISTHVLDTSRGRPAANVALTLERQDSGEWREMARASTDTDGRARELARGTPPGIYRLTFEVSAYFSALGQEHFFPVVSIVFEIRDATERYHVPLLISPFGYSTYRGS